MPEEFIKYLLEQWSMLTQVGVPFVIAVLLASGIIWGALKWRYGREMSLLKQYKDKLSGVSPDEAKALINNLGQQLANLKDKVEPRRLNEEQRRLIIENAALPEGTTYRISIQNEVGSDTTEYAGDFDNALRRTPGWQVRRCTFPPMPTFAPSAHGVLIVATPRNFGTPEILSIRRALDAASITYEFASHPAVSGNADVFLLIRPRRTCP